KPEAAAAKPAEAKSIPIAEIPQRADEDAAFALDVIERSASASAGKTAALADELAVLKRNVVALEARIQGDRLAALPLANIESLDRYLRFLDRELRALQAELQQSVRPTTEAAAEIVHRRKLWLDTIEAIAGEQLPTLTQRIDSVLKEFSQAEKALAQPLSQQLTLSRDTAATLARTGKAMAAVRAQIAGIDRKLWQRDTVGLFSALAQADLPQKFNLGALADDLRAELEFMDEFDRSFGGINNAALLLGVLSLPVFIGVSWRARKAIAANPALTRHPVALMRPVSAWLLLSLATLVLINFLGPTAMLKLLLALAWVPIMRLQPERIRHLLGGWVYLSGVFLLLHLFGQLIGGLTLLHRLVVLLNGLLMLVALGGLLWRLRRAAPPPRSRLQRTVHGLAVAGSAAIAVAVGANLAGNITLAAMLTNATLISGYLGLFLLAAGSVVRSWAAFVFRPVAEKLMAEADHAGSLLQVASRLFDMGLMLAWLYGTLDAFRILRPLQAWLAQVFAWRLEFGNIAITVGGTVLFLVSVFLSFWVAKTVRGILAKDVLPRMSLPRGVANSASTMTYYLLLMLGLVVALAAAGFEVSQLAIVIGALSLGIGLGLQTVVNNFVSGLILMFERPIQPGDTVEVSGTVGTVRDIGMRATTFTTFEGADVVVPNGMLLSEKLINWTLSSNTRRIDIPVGVAYGSDPEKVRALLLEVTQRTERVARQPPPAVMFTGFGASSLDFSVRAWTHFDDHPIVRSALGLAIHAALRDAGIEIPFPQQDLHLRSIERGLFDRLHDKADPAAGETASTPVP
ncbi:MAG TPA: mechanosensitive ion channel domain-containing protein, partial [Rubrivivax sp.]|nr:mechanosensitive ion channel domain-containing protein [Rubrivivax sp.]